MSSGDAVRRLRRALAEHPEDTGANDLSERLARAFEGITGPGALNLERRLTAFATAAEQLGPDATVEDIVSLGCEIERRAN